jgi:hypothetical protein
MLLVATLADIILLEIVMERKFNNQLLIQLSSVSKMVVIVAYSLIAYGSKKALLPSK